MIPAVKSRKKYHVLFDLINYAGIAEESIGIIYYNLARIEKAQGNENNVKKHLQAARKYSNKLIEQREKIDPIFKS